MAVERFLGAGWAAVHGPADAHALLVFLLEQGFAGVVPAPAPRPMDWSAIAEAATRLPVKFVAVRASAWHGAGKVMEAGLATGVDQDRLPAVRQIEAAIVTARRVGCGKLILEPGHLPTATLQEPGAETATARAEPNTDLADPAVPVNEENLQQRQALWRSRMRNRDVALDQACRSLFEIGKRHPDMELCLTPSRSLLGLGEPFCLDAILSDLRQQRVSYWHDTAAVAVREIWLGQEAGQFLEMFSNRLSGMTLGDHQGGMHGLPPGGGGVDYPLLHSYRKRLRAALPVVLELDPAVSPAEVAGAHSFLNKFGL